ncbi:MAG: hypothetical protein ABH862_00250 [Candidatus Omnitrophota bacterium]
MRFILTALLILTFLLPPNAGARIITDSLPEGDWDRCKSTHFVIYYHPSIDKDYIKEFSRKCEEYHDTITDRLGFKRVNFWLWEDRAKVFIYKDRESYVKGTGREAWSGASVYYKEKVLNTFFFEGDFFDVILPHEISHIILREAIGVKTRVPLWFEEGVACANEKDSLARYLMVVKRIVEKNEFISLRYLDAISYGGVMVPRTFYPTAAAVIIFLFENNKWGKSKFTELCSELKEIRTYREETFYGVLNKVYGISGVDELDKDLLEFIDKMTYQDLVEKKRFDVKW